jgi:hypothetical protein
MDKDSAPMDKHSAPDPSRLPAGPPLKLRAHGQPRGLTTPYMSPVGAYPTDPSKIFLGLLTWDSSRKPWDNRPGAT